MSEPIAAVSNLAALDAAGTVDAGAAPASGGVDFAQWFNRELAAVDGQLKASEQGLRSLAAGDAVSLHEVMMRAEEARLSFQLVVQLRNHVLEAYQEIMRMQA
ncbi:flagellar hook-basal body complex protein FliE [Rhizobacter sp. P5_C2]|jgi:flagellar hook-basal body complex protein FliE